MPYVAVNVPRPTLVTVTTSPASIFPGSQRKWVHSLEIYLRSLGGATYVRLGDAYTQERTISSAGESTVFDCPQGGVLDAAGVFVKCDAGAPVIEITVLDSSVVDAEVIGW